VPPDALSLTIPPETEAVPRILDAIEAWCDTHDIGAAVAHRLGVVVEELAANVAMHGTGGPDGATFVAVTVRHQADAIVATVEDDGRPLRPARPRARWTPELPLEEREIGGPRRALRQGHDAGTRLSRARMGATASPRCSTSAEMDAAAPAGLDGGMAGRAARPCAAGRPCAERGAAEPHPPRRAHRAEAAQGGARTSRTRPGRRCWTR
jgi:serine/threonine-protein kinase RsbW